MSHVQLGLLGAFNLAVGGNSDVELRAKKAQALLCYLASHPDQPISREKLATLLWTENADEFARTNLRQCLAVVRKTLKHDEYPSVVSSGSALFLDPANVSSDIAEFERLQASGTPESLELALSLYRGEMLEGVGLDDCAFADWLAIERQRRLQSLTLLCHELLDHHRQNGNLKREFSIATQLVTLDAVDEAAHRSLMYCHNQLDRRNLALRQYETCKRVLRKELATLPERATQVLYETIVTQNLSVATQPSTEQASAPADTNAGNLIHPTTVDDDNRSWYQQSRWEGGIAAAVAAALVGLVLLAGGDRAGNRVEPNPSMLSLEAILDSADAASDKLQPTIAVLPFNNLSDDAAQDYFSDGLSEDLITDLSRIAGLTIIARSSSFAYRSANPDIVRIADELNATVVLLGSLRKVGDRVRINTQLINATDGTQLWANRYDRNLSDILQVQDEISKTIVHQLSIKLSDAEQKRLDRMLEVNPDAYDLFLKSLRPIRELTPTGSAEARRILLEVIEIDSGYARAWAILALTYAQSVNFGIAENNTEYIQLGFKYAKKAAKLDASLPQLYFVLAALHQASRNHDEAIATAQRSIELDPNYADGYGILSQSLILAGDLKNAARAVEIAKALNPRYTYTYLWLDGMILFYSKQYHDAVAVFRKINSRNPSFVPSRTMLISAYGHLNQLEDAEWEIAELLTLRPLFSIEQERQSLNFKSANHIALYVNGLKKAGL